MKKTLITILCCVLCSVVVTLSILAIRDAIVYDRINLSGENGIQRIYWDYDIWGNAYLKIRSTSIFRYDVENLKEGEFDSELGKYCVRIKLYDAEGTALTPKGREEFIKEWGEAGIITQKGRFKVRFGGDDDSIEFIKIYIGSDSPLNIEDIPLTVCRWPEIIKIKIGR